MLPELVVILLAAHEDSVYKGLVISALTPMYDQGSGGVTTHWLNADQLPAIR